MTSRADQVLLPAVEIEVATMAAAGSCDGRRRPAQTSIRLEHSWRRDPRHRRRVRLWQVDAGPGDDRACTLRGQIRFAGRPIRGMRDMDARLPPRRADHLPALRIPRSIRGSRIGEILSRPLKLYGAPDVAEDRHRRCSSRCACRHPTPTAIRISFRAARSSASPSRAPSPRSRSS